MGSPGRAVRLEARRCGGASRGRVRQERRSELRWEALKDTVEEQVRGHFEQGRTAVPDDINVEATVVSGSPAETLADVARTAGSILVLGSRPSARCVGFCSDRFPGRSRAQRPRR